MAPDRTADRRTILKTLAVAGAVTAGSHTDGPPGRDDDLRFFSEATVEETHETVVQGNDAYVATGT